MAAPATFLHFLVLSQIPNLPPVGFRGGQRSAEEALASLSLSSGRAGNRCAVFNETGNEGWPGIQSAHQLALNLN